MKKLLFIVINLIFFLQAKAAPKTDQTMFPNAKKDIEIILNNQIFKKYQDFNIINIRQGEVGEAMTYFIVLEKPFQTETSKVCFMFQSPKAHTWKPFGRPGDCKD